jgi:hypothetical protein
MNAKIQTHNHAYVHVQCDDEHVADSATACVARLCHVKPNICEPLFNAHIHILLLRQLLRHAHAIVSAGVPGDGLLCTSAAFSGHVKE